MVTLTPKLGLHNPEDPDDANDAVRVWRTADNAVLDDAVLGANLPAAVGPALPSAQLLTNPGMEVWQRSSGPFSANLAYTADRWRISLAGSSTIAVNRETTTVDAGSGAAASVAYTHNTASNLQQVVEDYLQLRGRTLTFTMRVRASVPNAVRLFLYDSVALQRYSGYHSGGGAYETLSVTAPIAAGTTTVIVAAQFTASGTFYLDNALLVAGTAAPAYAPLHPADEATRCKRYYWDVGGTDPNELVAVFQAFSGTNALGDIRYPVEMAVVPTVTVSAPSDFSLLSAAGSNVSCTALAGAAITRTHCRLSVTVASGLVAGNASVMAANSTLAARLRFEANPP